MLKLLAGILLLVAPVHAAETFWEKVSWNTSDGIVLVGLYHPAHRPGAYTWILMHGLGSSKEEWDGFAKKLAQQGDGSFIYDARGHNESVQTTAGAKVAYTEWRAAGPGTPWDMMPRDVATAVELLKKKYQIPENRIALGGASLGANVALVYAAQHPLVPALVLLSPGMEYAGIQTPVSYKTYQGHPVFIAASPEDHYAYSSVQQLSSLATSPTQTLEYGAGGHGVQMLKNPFAKKLLSWMRARASGS